MLAHSPWDLVLVRLMRCAVILLLAVFVTLAYASYPKCDASLPVGSVCYIKASHVKPTQFAYGRVASACKAQYLESMSSSKLDKYLTKYVRGLQAMNTILEILEILLDPFNATEVKFGGRYID